MTRFQFIAYGLTFIGLISVVLLSVRDHKGKVSLGTVAFLLVLVIGLVGGIVAAYWRAWHGELPA